MVVSVLFRNGYKTYDYLTDLELNPGELVVVPAGPRDFSVAKVMGLKEQSAKATAWVVQKVDVLGFRKKMRERQKVEA